MLKGHELWKFLWALPLSGLDRAYLGGREPGLPDSVTKQARVIKVDEDLGLVFGFAIICKEDGEPYFDLQGDHIPEPLMLESALDFMQKSRRADDMHDEAEQGSVVFSFPFTQAVADALGIVTKQTGWLVGMKPSPEVFKLYKSGERRGFSIGGSGAGDAVED